MLQSGFPKGFQLMRQRVSFMGAVKVKAGRVGPSVRKGLRQVHIKLGQR